MKLGSDITVHYAYKRYTIVIIIIYSQISCSNTMYAALQITLLETRSYCSVISTTSDGLALLYHALVADRLVY